MVNFCNPGVLGTPAEFRKKYERPILEGREPGVGLEKVPACADQQCVVMACCCGRASDRNI